MVACVRSLVPTNWMHGCLDSVYGSLTWFHGCNAKIQGFLDSLTCSLDLDQWLPGEGSSFPGFTSIFFEQALVP